MAAELVREIERHPASSHTVFATLAKQKTHPETLAAFLQEMGAFCQASRSGGMIADVLRAQSLERQAVWIDQIFRSEQGHGNDFAQMAKLLLRGSLHATLDWTDCGWCDHDETRAAQAAFKRRESDEPADAFWSLGAMLVVELAAHRLIIPGEVAAFIDSGSYGLTLEEVPYLHEHAGEHGAEHDHEDLIVKVIATLPADPEIRSHVGRGTREFLDILHGFYGRLETIIGK